MERCGASAGFRAVALQLMLTAGPRSGRDSTGAATYRRQAVLGHSPQQRATPSYQARVTATVADHHLHDHVTSPVIAPDDLSRSWWSRRSAAHDPSRQEVDERLGHLGWLVLWGEVLSSAGVAFLPGARSALVEASRAARAVRDAANGATGELVIGALGSALNAILPPLVRSFLAQSPNEGRHPPTRHRPATRRAVRPASRRRLCQVCATRTRDRRHTHEGRTTGRGTPGRSPPRRERRRSPCRVG